MLINKIIVLFYYRDEDVYSSVGEFSSSESEDDDDDDSDNDKGVNLSKARARRTQHRT